MLSQPPAVSPRRVRSCWCASERPRVADAVHSDAQIEVIDGCR